VQSVHLFLVSPVGNGSTGVRVRNLWPTYLSRRSEIRDVQHAKLSKISMPEKPSKIILSGSAAVALLCRSNVIYWSDLMWSVHGTTTPAMACGLFAAHMVLNGPKYRQDGDNPPLSPFTVETNTNWCVCEWFGIGTPVLSLVSLGKYLEVGSAWPSTPTHQTAPPTHIMFRPTHIVYSSEINDRGLRFSCGPHHRARQTKQH